MCSRNIFQHHRIIVLAFAAAIACAGFVSIRVDTAFGQGVSLSPQRVVLEGRKRSAEVTLINSGPKETTYRIYFTNKRMLENGKFETIEKPLPGELFADHMIRYAPRRVTIPGNGSQSVRLLVRKPRDLPPGEYRSRLVVATVPEADSGTSIESLDLKPGEISVKINRIFAVTIPVIVRQGKLNATAKIGKMWVEPPQMPDQPANLVVRLNREGNRSVHGDLIVTYWPNHDEGKGVEVGVVRGLSLYSPYDGRIMRVPLHPPDGIRIGNGALYTVFREKEDAGGAVLSRSRLNLP